MIFVSWFCVICVLRLGMVFNLLSVLLVWLRLCLEIIGIKVLYFVSVGVSNSDI